MVGPDIVQTFSDTPFFWSRKDIGRPQQQEDIVQVSLRAGLGLDGGIEDENGRL